MFITKILIDQHVAVLITRLYFTELSNESPRAFMIYFEFFNTPLNLFEEIPWLHNIHVLFNDLQTVFHIRFHPGLVM